MSYQRHTPPAAEEQLGVLALELIEYRRKTGELAHRFAIEVQRCIDAGATWAEVGRVLGMSKQGARAHWGGTTARTVDG